MTPCCWSFKSLHPWLMLSTEEEFAKVFLLFLVKQEIIPWDGDLLRAMNSHACKHLVAIFVEYDDPQWETIQELRSLLEAEFAPDGAFPKPVSSALNILYFEKIRRGDFFNDNDYDPEVVRIATGERDKVKQDAVYVRIDRSGRVENTPLSVTLEAAAGTDAPDPRQKPRADHQGAVRLPHRWRGYFGFCETPSALRELDQ
jgi:hypothetical protein